MNFTLLLTYGRTGSTAFMRALSAHPAFVVSEPFPYEVRLVQYILATQSCPVPAGFAPVTVGNAEYRAVLPGNQTLLDAAKTAFAESGDYSQKAQAGYGVIAAAQQKSRPEIILEKGFGLNLAPTILQTWPGSRSVILLRDPRSAFFSIKSFNKKRGYLSFGEANGDEFLFNSIVQYYMSARKLLAQFLDEGRILEVRYEEMMANPDEFFSRIVSFHGIPVDPDEIIGMEAAVTLADHHTEGHQTSNQSRSIARWEDDAEDDHRSIFSSRARELALLGYQ
ncbi:sulfotransferase family protein [Propylenella binzhouense]|uniref:Sulfotransferase n=1 Tax=Propylenella binzhouense TaxID=2555902 RepID=A0A964WSK4_9HYPH|nr:sulfotransferase [Propylenella binzhouense]MYZ47062.1 sulfotransferase [Propylenella binzhouense]